MASLFGQFQLLQSGYAGPEERDIPIDVSWKSLSGWLIDCRLVTRDVLDRYAVKKTMDRSMELFNALVIQNHDLSENHPLRVHSSTLSETLSLIPWIYTYFDYYIIFDTLLEHSGESQSKTLLGNFQSPLLHAWEETRLKWTKGNAHVAHAALVLSQAIRYEHPILKTSLEHSNKVLQTSLSKELALSSTIQSETSNYETLFRKYSLPIHSLDDSISQSELEIKLSSDLRCSLCSSLPSAAEALVKSFKDSKDLKDAIVFFRAWMTALVPGQQAEKLISSLQLVLDQGHQQLLPKSTESTTDQTSNTDNTDSDAIDWGDWGTDISQSSPDTPAPIELLPSENATTSYSELRRALSNDLEELSVFFKQRLSDLSNKSDFLDLVMGRTFSTLPEYVRQYGDSASLNRLLHAVNGARTALNTFETDTISIIESDVRLLEIVSSLVQKRSKIVQLRRSLQVVATRRQESMQQVERAMTRISAAKEAILGLKIHLEAALSKLCGGRVVTISLNVDL